MRCEAEFSFAIAVEPGGGWGDSPHSSGPAGVGAPGRGQIGLFAAAEMAILPPSPSRRSRDGHDRQRSEILSAVSSSWPVIRGGAAAGRIRSARDAANAAISGALRRSGRRVFHRQDSLTRERFVMAERSSNKVWHVVRRLKWPAVVLAACGIAFNPTLEALASNRTDGTAGTAAPVLQEAANRPGAIVDVELSPEGGAVFRLREVPAEGGGRAILVMSRSGTQVVARADSGGVVRLSGLVPGVYRVSAGESFATVRCWAFGTAPPNTSRMPTIGLRRSVVRAQAPVGSVALPRDPAFAVGSMLLLAGAISIPIAIADANEDIEPASP